MCAVECRAQDPLLRQLVRMTPSTTSDIWNAEDPAWRDGWPKGATLNDNGVTRRFRVKVRCRSCSVPAAGLLVSYDAD